MENLENNKMEKRTKLKRELGLGTAVYVVINMVIGSGIFFKPQAVFAATGAPGIGLLILLVSGIITLAGVYCACELSASIPKTGGMPVWLEEAFGPIWSYLCGWMQTLISMPAILAILCIAFGNQIVSMCGLPVGSSKFIGCAVLYFLFIINLIGAKFSAKFGSVFTVAKLIPLVAIIVFGIAKGGAVGGGAANLVPFINPSVPLVSAIGTTMLACMYAYEGWIHVGNIGGELKNPERDTPRALLYGIVGITIIYMLVFIGELFVLPASVLAKSATPAADVAVVLFGKTAGTFITIGILTSLFATMNTLLLVDSKIPYSMAVQNKLPFSDKLAYVHPKFSTPIVSQLLILFLTTVYTFSGTYNSLSDMATFILWVFYTMCFIAVIVLRKSKPDLRRPFKTPLYPIMPIFAALGGVFIFVTNLMQQPRNVGIGLLLTFLGLPFYYARKSKFKDVDVIDA